MGFRKLLEMSDKVAREELGAYYIISENRMNNYLHCLENGAEKIRELGAENQKLKDQISDLKSRLVEEFSLCVEAEPEYPGELPEELRNILESALETKDMALIITALRATVRLSKAGIIKRISG